MKTIGLIPGKGLGDLIIIMGLAYNLSKKFKVIIFHPFFDKIHHLMPYANALGRPQDESDFNQLNIDHLWMIYENTPYFEMIFPKLKRFFEEKLVILNPVVTGKKDYLFVENHFFDCSLSFTQNLLDFAKTKLGDESFVKTSGQMKPLDKDAKLVIIHASSSKPSKSWHKSGFQYVKKHLEKKGFQVVYATLPHEKEMVDAGMYSGLKNLDELIEVIKKSSLVIGNESGVCHLASCLHTPSIVLCRNYRIQKFWGADYEGKSIPLFPPKWTPNLKILRIRDKYWQKLISKKKVLQKAFEVLSD
jgi:hypothetical protein